MTRTQFAVMLVVVAVAGTVGGALAVWLRSPAAVAQPPADAQPPEEAGILGLVRDGKFHPVSPRSDLPGPMRLTGIKMQESIPPEAGELDLRAYEGMAIMVVGRGGGGGWVYSAAVVDAGRPIATRLVEEVFRGDG